MREALELTYWFTPYPGPLTGIFFWIISLGAGFCAVSGVVLRLGLHIITDSSYRRAAKRFSNLLVTHGILGGVTFFFMQTQTPVLGSRFWFALWFLIAITWTASIVRYVWRVIPAEQALRQRQQERLKYLPRGNR